MPSTPEQPTEADVVREAARQAGGDVTEKTRFVLAGRRLFYRVGNEWYEAA